MRTANRGFLSQPMLTPTVNKSTSDLRSRNGDVIQHFKLISANSMVLYLLYCNRTILAREPIPIPITRVEVELEPNNILIH